MIEIPPGEINYQQRISEMITKKTGFHSDVSDQIARGLLPILWPQERLPRVCAQGEGISIDFSLGDFHSDAVRSIFLGSEKDEPFVSVACGPSRNEITLSNLAGCAVLDSGQEFGAVFMSENGEGMRIYAKGRKLVRAERIELDKQEAVS